MRMLCAADLYVDTEVVGEQDRFYGMSLRAIINSVPLGGYVCGMPFSWLFTEER